MSKVDRHVVPNSRGGWSVRHSGAARATRTFSTQADAVRFARSIAKKERTTLYVHRSDGTVRQMDTFGTDPYSPKDRG